MELDSASMSGSNPWRTLSLTDKAHEARILHNDMHLVASLILTSSEAHLHLRLLEEEHSCLLMAPLLGVPATKEGMPGCSAQAHVMDVMR